MADFIVMPKLGFDMREGEFATWHKSIGEMVTKGDVVAEIESDKATLELESQVTGILLATMASPGDIVAVGENVGIVGEEGEDVSGLTGGSDAAAESAPAAEAAPAESAPAPAANGTAAAAAPAGVVATPNNEFPGGVKATPVARRMAAEHGIDLLTVPFEGERIRKADVEAVVSGAVAPVSAPSAPPAAAAPAAAQTVQVQVASVNITEDDTVIPASRLRQAIARRMTESKTTVPHFQVTMEIEMDAAMALRKDINAKLEKEGIKVSVNDLLVKAAGLALREFPNINASFNGDTIVLHNRIHVGSAVATDNGLLTVVQKDTDKTTLSQVAVQNREMIGRAREGKVHPDDVSGSTFTLSNLGVYGVAEFTAIINPPEAGILAIGGIHQKPVIKDGEISTAKLMKVTISADHRVTDGAEAAQFLVKYKELMENPMRLLL